MDAGRRISLAVFVGGLAISDSLLMYRGLPSHWQITVELLIIFPIVLLGPMALIWFGDALGDYTGPISRGYIDQKSPGILVKIFGWVFLLIITFWFIYLSAFGSPQGDGWRR